MKPKASFKVLALRAVLAAEPQYGSIGASRSIGERSSQYEVLALRAVSASGARSMKFWRFAQYWRAELAV